MLNKTLQLTGNVSDFATKESERFWPEAKTDRDGWPGPTMLRNSTTREGSPCTTTPRAFFSGGPWLRSSGWRGAACLITPTDLSVFWCSKCVVMPWWVLPSPSPSFHPIFCIMRCAKLELASASCCDPSLPGLPSLQRSTRSWIVCACEKKIQESISAQVLSSQADRIILQTTAGSRTSMWSTKRLCKIG